jgi:hypothetical protein
MSTAEHPQTEGQAEAGVKVIQKLLKPKDTWNKEQLD